MCDNRDGSKAVVVVTYAVISTGETFTKVLCQSCYDTLSDDEDIFIKFTIEV